MRKDGRLQRRVETVNGGLVGREGPQRALLAALDDAVAGRTRFVLVSGEAGIGKTSLVAAVVAGVAERGALVTWGTSWAGVAPGFWPWTQALDALCQGIGEDRAVELAGEDRARLASVVTVLGEARHDHDDPDRARLLLFDAIARWLARIAAVRPLVLVLEDLHWADHSTLLLLDFLTRVQHATPLLLVATYRHDELEGSIRALVTDLTSRADHVHLTGLDADEVRDLVARIAGEEAASHWADEIHRRAGGHPFFVREIAHLIGVGGEPGSHVPAAVRDAVARRLARLPEATRAVLDVAAVAGNDLLTDVLAEALGLACEDVIAAIREAAHAEVIHVPNAALRPRFTHDLFRETLYHDLAPRQRIALHQRVAQALEARATRVGDVPPAELARHFAAALSVDGPKRAVRWALAAAAADREGLAFAEAAAQLTRLRLAFADAGATIPQGTRVDLLVAEADALARAGEAARAKPLLDQARELAQADGDGARLAAVAFGVQQLGARFAMPRHDVVAVLEAALTAVEDTDVCLQARITAALARELHHSVSEERPRARPLSERALTLARQAEDPSALAACLLARHDVLWAPGTAQERLAVAHEIVGLAEQCGDAERRAEGLLLVANALLETGSPAFRPALDAYLAAVDASGQPRNRYFALTRRAALALLYGQLHDAASMIDEAAALGERIREPDTGNVRMSQVLELTRARADPDEQRAFAEQAVRWWVGAPLYAHAVAAGFLARAGDLDDVRREVGIVLELGTWQAERSYLWSALVGNLAEAAVRLRDPQLCQALLDDLLPVASSCGVNGAVVAFAGSYAHFAGILAGALGRREQASVLLSQGLDVHLKLGATVWQDRSRRALEALAADGDRAGRSVTTGHGPQARTATLRRSGRAWIITFQGTSAVVPDVKGVRDLAFLVTRPGTDVHALELAGSPMTPGTPLEAADRTALVAYRRRLAELDEDRDEAQQHHDVERIGRIDQEREAVLDELRSATGLAGRPRQVSSHPSERARKAVSARIRDAIRRIESSVPELAAHLDRSVVTGTWCSYRTNDAIDWDIAT